MTAEVMRPTAESTQAPGFTPETQTPPENGFPYQLQERVFNEWRPNLLENGQGSPAKRVEAFRQRKARLQAITGSMSAVELDDPQGLNLEDVLRYGNYLKIMATDGATALHIEVGSFIDKKVMEKMQEKYPADAVYSQVREGHPPLEVMAALKYMHEEKLPLSWLGPIEPVSLEEWRHRTPRKPAFRDAHQDVVDVWQRRAYGLYLRASDRLPNVYGEAEEYLDEFEGMNEEEINSLAKKDGWVSAYDEPQTEQENKLHAIGGEAADVIIGWDGYASAINDEQEESTGETLKGMIDRYRKTIKLVRAGIPEPRAIHLQREVAKRKKIGGAMPFMPAAAAAILLG